LSIQMLCSLSLLAKGRSNDRRYDRQISRRLYKHADGYTRERRRSKKLKEQQNLISDRMLELCAKEDIDSVKTPFGTLTRRVYSSYWTSDWDRMYKFIAENEAYHLLEKRIHNGNMREFLEENPDVLPMGLQSDRRYAVSVRKPTNK